MASWSQILNDVQAHMAEAPNYINTLRLKYLNEVSVITGRNVIAYYSGWLNGKATQQIEINDNDKNAFMNAVYGMDRKKGLDIILHTPGGDIAATESIVSYLKKLFNNDIRAIIPQISMSAGTMIALACKEIIMGKQSSLGPIDPQQGGVPCQMVVDEFKRAVSEVSKNPASLGLWQTIISQYHPTFLTSCEDAIKWSEKLAEDWLKDVNPNIDITKIKDTFINHKSSFSHNRHFSQDDCRKAGLNITDLENNQSLQDAVLSLHHCHMIIMDQRNIIKMVENQMGSLYIQQSTEKK